MATEGQWVNDEGQVVDIGKSEGDWIEAPQNLAVETPGVGAFPQQSQPIAAISRGILGGATAGLGEAALGKAIEKDIYDPASPQFTNPYTYGFSEIIGGVISPSKIIQGAVKGKKLLTGGVQAGKAIVAAAPNLAKTGAAYGFGYGAAGGEAEALREDAGLEESIKKTLSGGAKGAGVGLATGGLISKAQSLKMNPAETFLAFVKPRPGSKAETRTFDLIDQGKLDQAVGSVKNFFKVPKNLTVEQAKDLSYETADKLISKVDDIEKQFPTYQLNGSPLRQGLQTDVLDQPLLKALDSSSQKELTEIADKIAVDRTLGEGIALQKNINSKLKSYIESIKAGGDPKVDDKIKLLDTLRRYNSNLLDDAFTGLTGTTDNPYRRWGAVNEVANVLHSRYQNLFNLRSQEKAAGLLGSIGTGRGMSSIVTGPYKYIAGGEMKNADTLVSSLFNKIPEYKISALPGNVSAQRIGRSVIVPTPPAIPNAPLTPQQLQALQNAQSASPRAIPNLPTSGPLLTPEFGVAPSPAAVLPGQANLDALLASYGKPNPMGPFPQRAPLNQLEQAMVNAQAAAAAEQAARRAAELRGTLSYF